MTVFKTLISFSLLLTVAFSGFAKTTSKSRNAHSAAHSQLMANAGSKLDKYVLSDLVKAEIAAREKEIPLYPNLSRESANMIDDLLKEASSHMGKRYVHGAKGPSAFDCSGFSSYVYRQFGFNISPSSRAQYLEGVPVADRKDLRKGDLVFFTSRSSRGAVGHVGIVTEADATTGNFKFIHASIRGVKVSDFAGYYVGRYIGAKRIITE